MYIYNYHVSPQPLTSLPTFDSLTTFDLLYNLWPLVKPNISHLDVLPWSEANLSSILSIGLPLSLLPPNLAAVVTFSSCPLMSPKNVYCLTREINVYSQIVSAISMTLFHLSVVFALCLYTTCCIQILHLAESSFDCTLNADICRCRLYKESYTCYLHAPERFGQVSSSCTL